jgi:hypothetical protein
MITVEILALSLSVVSYAIKKKGMAENIRTLRVRFTLGHKIKLIEFTVRRKLMPNTALGNC